jgi:nitroimidazol reductase NimA-like FMN-containing flavoprotein (pyridoxamine 5'-phosphate oxidase superfamily)
MRPESDWNVDPGLDLAAFLARPLVAHLATAGPTVHPIWFLWEQERFWWLTGGWSQLPARLDADPRAALVIDSCDLASGEVLQVAVSGVAEVVPFDAERARRKLVRYLGDDEARWDERFRSGTFNAPSVRFVALAPRRLRARDLSFNVARHVAHE